MIKYVLRCRDGHRFESWFQSSEAYDRLTGLGQVACAVCQSPDVEKAVMAPQVASGKEADPSKDMPGTAPLSAPASPAEQSLRSFRQKLEASAENVGRDFASEARRIHHGEAPERAIYGEAKIDDAKSLLEDGIEVAPIPWMVSRTDS